MGFKGLPRVAKLWTILAQYCLRTRPKLGPILDTPWAMPWVTTTLAQARKSDRVRKQYWAKFGATRVRCVVGHARHVAKAALVGASPHVIIVIGIGPIYFLA